MTSSESTARLLVLGMHDCRRLAWKCVCESVCCSAAVGRTALLCVWVVCLLFADRLIVQLSLNRTSLVSLKSPEIQELPF